MKKNHLILTGIALLMAILVAAGCKSKSEPQDPGLAGGEPKAFFDATNPKIYLRDSMMEDSTMHLFMYDKSPECGVIDDHLIVVKRNHTVKWKNDKYSNITEILQIRPVGDSAFWGAVPVVSKDYEESTDVFRANGGVFILEIPEDATLDTIVKYEIKFIVGDDTTTIDPYLRIPPAPSSN
jgi:hypothetical protein